VALTSAEDTIRTEAATMEEGDHIRGLAFNKWSRICSRTSNLGHCI
jgi:hypothetical protein